ncbi:ABC transporter permease [Sporosarcina sp. NPDC096371]|uniref:ABC transporter permease n=1 Tax=Sporosarcina sp. NPDC096371 TaxID=3364530 RepID=UPI0037F98674
MEVGRVLSLRRLLFFIQQNTKLLRKKWATLLLLFLFPIVLIGLLLGLVMALVVPDDNSSIRVALVDEDRTKESQLFSSLLEEIGAEDSYIQIIALSAEQAQQLMALNEISTYFTFPEGFTADLYEGESVILPIVGNPARPTDSYLVKELVESMARYIGAAQANILTINDYAKKTNMSKEQRQELMLQQFMDFTMYTLGKDMILDEKVLENVATSTPTHYYALAGWFISLSIWLLAFYTVLGKKEHPAMQIRLSLVGVSMWQRVFARMVVALMGSLVCATLLFIGISQFVEYEMYFIDYIRFSSFAILYALLLLVGIALLDIWVSSQKMGLLLQGVLTFALIFTSGAVIPTLYFPLVVQRVLPYVYSYDSLQWMIDIVVEGRNYADFTSLTMAATVGLMSVWLSTVGKERWGR